MIRLNDRKAKCRRDSNLQWARKFHSMSWWKHAFAVEPAGPTVPTPEQQTVIDDLCRRVVERGMATPAILFLESSQPLGPMAAQGLLLLQPWFELAVDRKQLALLTRFLDQRGSFEAICRRLEELAAQDRPGDPSQNAFVPSPAAMKAD